MIRIVLGCLFLGAPLIVLLICIACGAGVEGNESHDDGAAASASVEGEG